MRAREALWVLLYQVTNKERKNCVCSLPEFEKSEAFNFSNFYRLCMIPAGILELLERLFSP